MTSTMAMLTATSAAVADERNVAAVQEKLEAGHAGKLKRDTTNAMTPAAEAPPRRRPAK